MEKLVFLVIALGLAAILLGMAYQQKSMMFSSLFVVFLLIASAVYLFQFGRLSEFSISAFSAEAKLIREKVQEATADVAALDSLKEEAEKTANEVSEIAIDVRITEAEIEAVKAKLFGVESDLARVKKGLVEIEFLMYAGRNQFPNPYHDKILEILNELVVIAVPDEGERAKFIQDLQEFTEK